MKRDHSATLTSSGHVVEVKGGENLLQAALQAGLEWRHDCRVGACGTCRCRLVEGEIKPLSDFAYVLTMEELNEGMILACQTELISDVVVEVELDSATDKTVGITTCQGNVNETRKLTHDILELKVKINKCLMRSADPRDLCAPYAAGQYAEISVPGIEKPRSYSFASAPDDNGQQMLTFFIRHVEGGAFTDWLFEGDRVGSNVTINGPYGSFWLREGDEPFLCVAGGSGMSSIKALLEHACNKKTPREAVFLFGARTQNDLYCLEEMERIEKNWDRRGSFRFIPVLSREPEDSGWTGLRGYVTDYIDKQDLDLPSIHAYLCGPPSMVDSVTEFLLKVETAKENIHSDKFLDASSMPGGRK